MRFLFLFIILFILNSCITKQTYEVEKKSGFWEAKAQIRDLKTNKSYQVNLDILAQYPSSMRVDITGPMGVALATLVQDESHVRYILYREKKFYEGTLSEKSLYPLFTIQFNPKYLFQISFDKEIQETGWTCRRNGKGLVEICKRSSDDLKIEWKEREGERKRVFISSREFELQILYKDFKLKSTPLVQEMTEKKDPYQIEIPNGFTTYKIR